MPSANSRRFNILVEALGVHDELAADGLRAQAEELHEDSTWDDTPGAEVRLDRNLGELADYAAVILTGYLGDAEVKRLEQRS